MKKPVSETSLPGAKGSAGGETSSPSPSSASPQSSASPTRLPSIPDHELLRRIGGGSYGEVWLARSALGAYRAVKIVHRHSFDHDRPFEREFAGIQKFEPISRSHEGFVDLLQVGRNDTDGYFYYVMELADDASAERGVPNGESTLTRPADTLAQPMGEGRGEGRLVHSSLNPDAYRPHTLKPELQRRGCLPLEECIQLGLTLTDALRYLHGQGLVHRDIKPSNIIFAGGVPKLADVGLVAGVGEARSYVGTEGFIPPEGPGTPQADLYSLGIVLYQLSTGKSHQEFPEPLPNLAAQPDHARWLEFNAIIHKACVADPRARHQNAEEMHAELSLLQRGLSVRHKRAVQRRWAIARKSGLAAVGLVLVVAALVLFGPRKHDHTPNPEAARLYELGRWHYNQLAREHHAKAFTYLTKAIQKDPEFVQPYAELIGLYVWCLMPGITNASERMEHTLEIAEKLKAIGPDLAERHMALSWCRYMERDWRGAEDEIVKAVTLKPRLALAHEVYSFYLSMLGRTAEAHREGQLAVEIEPSDSRRSAAIVAAWAFMSERRYEGAIEQLRRALELDESFPQGHSYLGDCYQAQSNYVAAIEEYRTADLLSAPESDKPYLNAAYTALRQAYDTQGERGYWEKWIELIREDEARPSETGIFSAPDIAGCYAKLGQKDKALDEMEKNFYWPNYSQRFKWDVLYDPLHNEPRFQALVKRAGLDN